MFGRSRPLSLGEVKRLAPLGAMAQYIPPKWVLRGKIRRKEGLPTNSVDNLVLFEGQDARILLDIEAECQSPKLAWSGIFEAFSDSKDLEIDAFVEVTYLGDEGSEGEFHRTYSLGNLEGNVFTLSDCFEIPLEHLQGGKVTLKVTVGNQVTQTSCLVPTSDVPKCLINFKRTPDWNLVIQESQGFKNELSAVSLEDYLPLSLEDLSSESPNLLKLTLEGLIEEGNSHHSLSISALSELPYNSEAPPFEGLKFDFHTTWVLPTLTLSAWSESHHKYSLTKANRVRESSIEYETLIQATASESVQYASFELQSEFVPDYHDQVEFAYDLLATNEENFKGSFRTLKFPHIETSLLSEGDLIRGSLEGVVRYPQGLYDLSRELFEPREGEILLPEVATLIEHYGTHYPTLLLCEKLEVVKGAATLTPGPLEGSPWAIQSIVKKMFDPDIPEVKLEPGDLETLLDLGHPLVYKVDFETSRGATISEETSLIVVTSEQSSKPSSASHTVVLPALLPSKEREAPNDDETAFEPVVESPNKKLPQKVIAVKQETKRTTKKTPQVLPKFSRPKRRPVVSRSSIRFQKTHSFLKKD